MLMEYDECGTKQYGQRMPFIKLHHVAFLRIPYNLLLNLSKLVDQVFENLSLILRASTCLEIEEDNIRILQ